LLLRKKINENIQFPAYASLFVGGLLYILNIAGFIKINYSPIVKICGISLISLSLVIFIFAIILVRIKIVRRYLFYVFIDAYAYFFLISGFLTLSFNGLFFISGYSIYEKLYFLTFAISLFIIVFLFFQFYLIPRWFEQKGGFGCIEKSKLIDNNNLINVHTRLTKFVFESKTKTKATDMGKIMSWSVCGSVLGVIFYNIFDFDVNTKDIFLVLGPYFLSFISVVGVILPLHDCLITLKWEKEKSIRLEIK